MLYTFFDVETPNRRNDRICSIGAVVTDQDGTVVEKKSYLVNPESSFDDINVRIHGIAPVDVRNAKTFPELWHDSLSAFFPVDGVVAHNARFDLSVLTKTLVSYDIPSPKMSYACTLDMSKKIDFIGGGKLPHVCEALGIELERHHQAESDATACMRVFWTLVGMAGCMPSFIAYEPGAKSCKKSGGRYRSISDKTKAMQWLIPLLREVVSNGKVSTFEAEAVLEFFGLHEELTSDPALSPIVALLQNAIADGWVDEAESNELANLISHIVNPSSSIEDSVDFANRKFVLTGSFNHGTKDDVSAFIQERGGEVLQNVTKTCDYVVIGGCGTRRIPSAATAVKSRRRSTGKRKAYLCRSSKNAIYTAKDNTPHRLEFHEPAIYAYGTRLVSSTVDNVNALRHTESTT